MNQGEAVVIGFSLKYGLSIILAIVGAVVVSSLIGAI